MFDSHFLQCFFFHFQSINSEATFRSVQMLGFETHPCSRPANNKNHLQYDLSLDVIIFFQPAITVKNRKWVRLKWRGGLGGRSLHIWCLSFFLTQSGVAGAVAESLVSALYQLLIIKSLWVSRLYSERERMWADGGSKSVVWLFL